MLLYTLLLLLALSASAKHHWPGHHHHHQNYFPFDFSFHRNRDYLMGLHDFEQTDDEKIPDSNSIIEMLEKDLELDIEMQKVHHKLRHHSKSHQSEPHWPVKKEAEVDGDIVLGGLMMVHEREDTVTCGPVMPQGGVQALEAMLYTLDRINADHNLLPNITLGAHILDDCDKDTYGLEIAVDFIKGKISCYY